MTFDNTHTYEEAYEEAKKAFQKRFLEEVLITVSGALSDRAQTWYLKKGLLKGKFEGGGSYSIQGYFEDELPVFTIDTHGFTKDVRPHPTESHEASLDIIGEIILLCERPGSEIQQANNFKTAPPRPSIREYVNSLREFSALDFRGRNKS